MLVALNVPQVDGSSSTSLVTLIAVAVLLGGPLLVLASLPQVREKFSEYVSAPQEYFFGDTSAPNGTSSDPDSLDDSPEGSPEAVRRREIEDFDLSIFKNT